MPVRTVRSAIRRTHQSAHISRLAGHIPHAYFAPPEASLAIDDFEAFGAGVEWDLLDSVGRGELEDPPPRTRQRVSTILNEGRVGWRTYGAHPHGGRVEYRMTVFDVREGCDVLATAAIEGPGTLNYRNWRTHVVYPAVQPVLVWYDRLLMMDALGRGRMRPWTNRALETMVIGDPVNSVEAGTAS